MRSNTKTPKDVVSGPGTPEITQQLPQVNDFLLWAILTTIFCCWIPGIIALFNASRVNIKLAIGDIDGARRSSEEAKKWVLLTVAISAGLLLMGIILCVVFWSTFAEYFSSIKK